MQKVYVPDTSVLFHDPYAIENFQDNLVVVPHWVVEELDSHKTEPNGKGAVARKASRLIDHYREQGSLHYERGGVELPGGGRLIVDYRGDLKKLPVKKLEDTRDNRILALAHFWTRKEKEDARQNRRKGVPRPVIVVTKDTNMRIKGDEFGIRVEDYSTDRSVESLEELYSGFQSFAIPQEQAGFLTSLYQQKKLAETVVWDVVGKQHELPSNICCQFVVQGSGGKTAYAIYNAEGRFFRLVEIDKHSDKRSERDAHRGITPLNEEQGLAFALLTDPNISLVTLAGRAGTGKTLLALAAAVRGLHNRNYERITVYRPNIEIGEKLGFLPGTLEEKFNPWMKPILDNLALVLHPMGSTRNDGNGKRAGMDVYEEAHRMLNDGQLEISPVNFVRGRSLNGEFVIVDEAQNLTPHAVKTIITRAGLGTKYVLTGDPEQIDDPCLNDVTNGLCYVIERFCGERTFGHLTMKKTERSPLAELASRLL